MIRLLLFIIFFTAVLAAEWGLGRYLDFFTVTPLFSVTFTLLWGSSDPLGLRLYRHALAGLVLDSISSLAFGSYTISLIATCLAITFMQFIFSNPEGFLKKNLISAAGLTFFLISIFLVSVLISFAIGAAGSTFFLLKASALGAAMLWIPVLVFFFSSLLTILPKFIR